MYICVPLVLCVLCACVFCIFYVFHCSVIFNFLTQKIKSFNWQIKEENTVKDIGTEVQRGPRSIKKSTKDDYKGLR